MRFDILTLFPEIFKGFLEESLIKKALDRGFLFIGTHNIREHTSDKHNTADDTPFGGGPGMVMMAEPVLKALDEVRQPESTVVMMSPSGNKLTDAKVKELSKKRHLVIICGRYEGIDERVRNSIDEEISIGDYVLSGGELPAAVLVEAVSRHIPGVIKEKASVDNDSFSDGLLDFPHYTRPARAEFGEAPEILLGGNHSQIAAWRRKQQLKRTLFLRPDLLASAKLSKDDLALFSEIIAGAAFGGLGAKIERT